MQRSCDTVKIVLAFPYSSVGKCTCFVSYEIISLVLCDICAVKVSAGAVSELGDTSTLADPSVVQKLLDGRQTVDK